MNSITVKVFRFDPGTDREHYYQSYEVPFEPGMSAIHALDYIYQNLDGTLAYHDHAGCELGICMKCVALVNGKSKLLCQALVEGDIVLEPVSKSAVIRDLVVKLGSKATR